MCQKCLGLLFIEQCSIEVTKTGQNQTKKTAEIDSCLYAFPSELPDCSEAAGAQRERVQGRVEGDLHVRVEPDRPRLREEDLGGGAQAVPAG